MRREIPEVEVDSCHRCPMRGQLFTPTMGGSTRKCQLVGVAVSYDRVPRGCPLRGGPVQIALSARAKENL
jgi:hypothetical protein